MVLGVGNWDPLIAHYKGAQRVGVVDLVRTGWEDIPGQVEREGIQDCQVSVDGPGLASHPDEVPAHFLNQDEVGGPSHSPCNLVGQEEVGSMAEVGPWA